MTDHPRDHFVALDTPPTRSALMALLRPSRRRPADTTTEGTTPVITRRARTSTLTGARRPARPETPPPTYSQAELRERRRKRMTVVYDGTFDLTAEVADIVDPLAEQVAADPHPEAYAVAVDDVVVAVAGSVRTFAVMVAERDARRRCRDVPIGNRGQAVRALVALADKPTDPEVTAEHLRSGEWAAILTEHARLVADGLADYLGTALPPGQTRNSLSVSELTEAEIREIDTAATGLARTIAAVKRQRAATSTPEADTRTEADRARETLATLGITP